MQLTINEVFTYFQSAKVHNFCARVIAALQRISIPGLGTMGVGISSEGRLRLYYDPEFIATNNLSKLQLVIQHELIHIIDDHIPRYLNLISGLTNKDEKARFKSVMNIAADLAANETIRTEANFDTSNIAKQWFFRSKDNPQSFIIPEDFNFPRNLSFEAYQTLLLKRQQQLNEYFQQYINNNIHKYWEDDLKGKNTEEIQGIADRIQQDARNLIRGAYNEYYKNETNKNRGTIPAWLKERIEAFLTVPTIPWPNILRSMVMRTRQTKIGRGMARPNRRFWGIPEILPFPGRAHDNRFTILFALDTSGSMNYDDLRQGLEELIHIIQMEPEIQLVVLYCDADLRAEYDVTSINDINFEISGRGGTDFNPIFQRVQALMSSERAPDIIIIATDGYAPAPEPENRIPIPVIWLLTPSGVMPSPDYGYHLRMEPQ